MVISREVINTRLKRLEKSLQILQQSSEVPFEELISNAVLLSAVERNLHVAIECILDIGNHIIAEKGFETPEDKEDIIRIIGDEKVVPSDFARRVKDIAGFRNILVHEYTDIDYGLLYNFLIYRLNDLREFALYISSYLEREKTYGYFFSYDKSRLLKVSVVVAYSVYLTCHPYASITNSNSSETEA